MAIISRMTQPLTIAGIGDLDIADVEDVGEDSPNVVKPRSRKDGKRGRAAFAADICELHPGTLDNPCRKFGHLPGNGVGPYKPSIFRKIRSMVIGLIKPLVLIGIVVVALYCGKLFLPNLFSADRFIPSAPSSNSDTYPDSNGDGNGSADGDSGKGQPESRKANTKRDRGSDSTSPIVIGNRRSASKESVKP